MSVFPITELHHCKSEVIGVSCPLLSFAVEHVLCFSLRLTCPRFSIAFTCTFLRFGDKGAGFVLWQEDVSQGMGSDCCLGQAGRPSKQVHVQERANKDVFISGSLS
jgi:hypothetical protein